MIAIESLLGRNALALASKLLLQLAAETSGRQELRLEGGEIPFDPSFAEYGVSIRVDYGAGCVQVALFGTQESGEQFARSLYQFADEHPVTPPMILDALGETLNLLAGRLKQSAFDDSGKELHLGLPQFFVGPEVRNFATRAIPISAARVASESLRDRFELVCSDRSAENLLREALSCLEGARPDRSLLRGALAVWEELCEARRDSGSDSELIQLQRCLELIARAINEERGDSQDALQRVVDAATQLLHIQQVSRRMAEPAEAGEVVPVEFAAQVSLPPDDISRAAVAELVRDAMAGLEGAEMMLAALERGGRDPERIARVLTLLQAIEESAAPWELAQLAAVAQATAAAVRRIGEGTLPVEPAIISSLLRATGLCRELVAGIERALDAYGIVSAEPAVAAQLRELALLGTARSDAAPNGGPAARARGNELIKIEASTVGRLEGIASAFARLEQSLAASNVAAGDALFRAQMSEVGARLGRVCADLRMAPIAPLLTQKARLARDLSLQLEKAIRVVLAGAETRVTARALDGLSEPLELLVRHTLQHGIETEEERRHAGKRPLATLELEAERADDGTVSVRLCDDGRGLDRGRILAKAIAAGTISRAAGAELSEAAAFQLLFSPGFFAAEQLRAAPTRAPGLDAARTAIEALGGRIEVKSQFGKGTTFRIVVPPAPDLAGAPGAAPQGEQVDAGSITFF